VTSEVRLQQGAEVCGELWQIVYPAEFAVTRVKSHAPRSRRHRRGGLAGRQAGRQRDGRMAGGQAQPPASRASQRL